MKAVFLAIVSPVRASFRTRVALQFEVLALRHQLAVYGRHTARPRIKVADHLLWGLAVTNLDPLATSSSSSSRAT